MSTNIPPSYANAGITQSELSTISRVLSTPVEQLPEIGQLTDAQLDQIRTADPQVHDKLKTQLGEVRNPSLAEPSVQLDTASMTMLIAELNKEIGELGIEFGKEGVKICKEKKKEVSDKRMKKIQEVVTKLEKAAKKEQASKVWGWIGAIAGFVAAAAVLVVAVAAAVATGGAAAPLVAFAVMGFLAAATSLTVQILEETGAMEAMMDATCKARGYNEEQTAKYKRDVRLAITITVAVVGLIGAVGSGFGIAKAGLDMATTGMKLFATVSAILEITEGASSIGQGVNNWEATDARYAAATAQADSKEFQAWLTKLQLQIDQETEELQQLMEKLQKLAFTDPKKILESLNETYMQMASNDQLAV